MSRLKSHIFSDSGACAPSAALVPAALAVASALALAWQIVHPCPVTVAGLGIDRLGALAGLFVSVVGSVVIRFADRSMQGHPERSRFLALLAFVTCMAFLVSCACSLLLLMVAWVLLGAGVHMLLVFGGDTPEVRRVARRKFVCARIGDVALLVAVVLLWWNAASGDLGACLSAVPQMSPSTLLMVALSVSLAAMVRSVQFPFHAWLPDSMEAPTPVSALLHAGIVNAGGILLVRFAPCIVRVPQACLLLSLAGTVTIVFGALAAARQLRLKQSLAWSTVAQMGFMVAQCGVGAHASAVLHLVGHGAYKASAFLRSGEVPPKPVSSPHAGRNLALLALGTACALAMFGPAASCTGFSPWHSPGETALACVVAIAIGQAWVVTLGAAAGRGAVMRACVCAVFVSIVAPLLTFGLYRAAQVFLQPVHADLSMPQGVSAQVAATMPVLAIALLAVVHAVDPWLQRLQPWRALQVQARGGFHMAPRIDRMLDTLSLCNLKQEVRHA